MEQVHSGPMAGKTVLITGGTGGIGRATALGLATMGAHLAITGRDRGRAEGAAREIRAAGGGQVDVFIADLSSQLEVRRLAEECSSALPGLMCWSTTSTSIYLASAPDLEQVTGRYFAGSKPRKSSKRSYDQAAAARLWQVSADLVGMTTAASPHGSAT